MQTIRAAELHVAHQYFHMEFNMQVKTLPFTTQSRHPRILKVESIKRPKKLGLVKGFLTEMKEMRSGHATEIARGHKASQTAAEFFFLDKTFFFF